MAILPILQFPSPRLKLVAKQVDNFDAQLEGIYQDMLATMYAEDGIGLAATQVDIQQRLFTLDTSKSRDDPFCFVNPKIVNSEGEITWEEGCLSFPGVYAKVKRHANITVTYQNLLGEEQRLDASELLSVCIQHEIDHLNGITFFDHLSPLKQKMVHKKYMKQRDNIS